MKTIILTILIGIFLYSCMPVITKGFLREKYGDKVGIRLYEENVKIGDTKEMIQDMYGKPTEIQNINLNVERWVYRRHYDQCRKYFYFDNDTLLKYIK